MEKKYRNGNLKRRLHEIIFEADTPKGKLFDIIIFNLILFSIAIVVLESVPSFDQEYHLFFDISEWVVTIAFTIEYILRIYCIRKPWKYIFSFYGIIDFISIIPKILSLIFIGTQYFLAVRIIRLLRVFRVLKLIKYVGEANRLAIAMRNSRPKILVFIIFVASVSVIIGTIMYIIEGPENGFTSIPKSVYWTIVTLTTVGYGDITPHTNLGQFLASIIMILGYGIIAVPTGIVSTEMFRASDVQKNTQSCPACSEDSHADKAKYCFMCGEELNPEN